MKQVDKNKPIIQAIIFDFDGVILQSAEIKTEAFLELFDVYPEHRETIRKYHLDHQGISRFNKFEWIYKNLLHRPFTEEAKEKLGQKFSDLVFNKIMAAPPVPGAIDLLERIKNFIPAFVASGTPDEELKKIIEMRGLSDSFEAVYGSTRSKENIIDHLIRNYNFRNSELLFVGDATTDYKAAKFHNLNFTAVHSPTMKIFWKQKNIQPVSDLREILERYNFEKN